MILEEKIEQIIEPALKDMGIEIVRINISGMGKRKTLQILIEKEDGSPINVSECGKASTEISAILDVEDIIADRYNLEVSSAGMERPLTKLKDYDKFNERAAKVETAFPLEGTNRKNFKGTLKGTKENLVIIECENKDNLGTFETFEIDFNDIQKAKLIVTEEMIKNALKKN